jgi:hypothetical protein
MNALTARNIQCPYCGESIEVLLDCSVEEQQYIEDCQVCCRPIEFYVTVDSEGEPSVSVASDSE